MIYSQVMSPEKLQMRPSLKSTKAKYGIDRTIIVADRGKNTSDNLVFIAGKNDDDHTNHDGYVYGQRHYWSG